MSTPGTVAMESYLREVRRADTLEARLAAAEDARDGFAADLDHAEDKLAAALNERDAYKAALEEIENGRANVPDVVLEGFDRPAFTSHMWSWSQKRAREALDAFREKEVEG